MTKNYFWVEETLDNVLEFINTGDAVKFQYQGKDYFIEGESFDPEGKGRVGSYLIADPCVDEKGNFTDMIEYSFSGQFRTANELLAAPFLSGRNFIEVFPELKFFD